jgi:hypothetical protein
MWYSLNFDAAAVAVDFFNISFGTLIFSLEIEMFCRPSSSVTEFSIY